MTAVVLLLAIAALTGTAAFKLRARRVVVPPPALVEAPVQTPASVAVGALRGCCYAVVPRVGEKIAAGLKGDRVDCSCGRGVRWCEARRIWLPMRRGHK